MSSHRDRREKRITIISVILIAISIVMMISITVLEVSEHENLVSELSGKIDDLARLVNVARMIDS